LFVRSLHRFFFLNLSFAFSFRPFSLAAAAAAFLQPMCVRSRQTEILCIFFLTASSSSSSREFGRKDKRRKQLESIEMTDFLLLSPWRLRKHLWVGALSRGIIRFEYVSKLFIDVQHPPQRHIFLSQQKKTIMGNNNNQYSFAL
jgi:hypothetical protein